MNPIKKKSNNRTWSTADHGHFVQFYDDDKELIKKLADYIAEGVSKNECCVVIATGDHRRRIAARLDSNPSFIKARLEGKYTELDAAETLEGFMRDGLPDTELFNNTLGKLVEQTARKNKSVRLYGEMVALLWRQGNKAAVIALEELWNKTLEGKTTPLFCAYPSLQFFMESDSRQQIERLHAAH